MSEIRNIAIFPNGERDAGFAATRETAQTLIRLGANVLLDRKVCGGICAAAEYADKTEILKRADMIVTLGGDGTILRVAADAASYGIPVLGINMGHLGFLTQAERGGYAALEQVLRGEFTVSEHMMLSGRIMENGTEVCRAEALNDIIMGSGTQKMLSFEVLVDGTVTNKHLADGMIVATSTGSTAYSLSCGGPIVHPGLECLVLTPVCPHTLKSRCIILPPDRTVTLRVDLDYSGDAEVRADGGVFHRLRDGEYIEVSRAVHSAKLVNVKGHSFFDVIREKLSE